MSVMNQAPVLKTMILGATDRGLVRETNEDSYAVDESLGFAIVADGLGGHAAGEIASKAAAEFVANEFVQCRQSFDSSNGQEIEQSLVRIVARTNDHVFQLSHTRSEFRGMGTTLDLTVAVKDTAYIAHVGDGRVYHIHNGGVRLVTKDHSLRADLLEKGEVRPDVLVVAATALSRAIGTHAEVRIDATQLKLNAGDSLILCTDGVWPYFESSPDDLARIVATHGTQAAAELVKKAVQMGGRDNATAVVMVLTL
jgi:PPM family protein phosphatase